jgi:hypothetical protein
MRKIQAQAQFVEDTLVTTGGWVLTSDTGQTAPASLAAPTGSNQKKGYRIYRMDDALAGSFPVYMRIDYGSGVNNTAGWEFGMWLTIGTGSNGTGTITGIILNGTTDTVCTVSEARQPGSSGTNTATNSYGSATAGRVQLGMFINTVANNPLVLSIERTKDSAGADTGDGLLLAFTSGNNGGTTVPGAVVDGCLTHTCYLVRAGGAQPTIEYGVSFTITRMNPSETFGGDIGVGILIHFKGIVQQPGIGMCVSKSSDVSAEGTFVMSLYGSSHTYQHLNALQVAVPTGGVAAARTDCRMCMRYD